MSLMPHFWQTQAPDLTELTAVRSMLPIFIIQSSKATLLLGADNKVFDVTTTPGGKCIWQTACPLKLSKVC